MGNHFDVVFLSLDVSAKKWELMVNINADTAKFVGPFRRTTTSAERGSLFRGNGFRVHRRSWHRGQGGAGIGGQNLPDRGLEAF